MSVYKLNPLEDSRWQRFVDKHSDSSIFHSTGWLEALRRTYGYQPIVYTTTPPGQELSNGLVFCRVQSWLSGCRLVSLPFSDYCQPLLDNSDSAAELMSWLAASQIHQRWKYIELRPVSLAPLLSVPTGSFARTESFALHVLDIRPDLEELFRCFDKSCIQRKIHRAEREQLVYDEGRSGTLLSKFYSLLVLTRRRHGVPPQPLAWFRNVVAYLKDKILIRVVSKGAQPVASIVTILNGDTLIYKYGCSDSHFNNLGGTPFLFWKAIQDAKRKGATKYDLGRSELNNTGLIGFKENWGARSIPLNYLRLPAAQAYRQPSEWAARLAKNVFSRMPEGLLTATGKLLYRHIG
jgi:CelD/BcsL family acetyltransferase involved in cellulose biosynthesis